jgi:hypothetical protein
MFVSKNNVKSNESEVRKIVNSLKYTAGGHDQITAKMVKLILPFGITALAHIVTVNTLIFAIFLFSRI